MALALLVLPALAQGAAAVVTDAKGTVQWKAEGSWKPARLLTRLPEGAEVRVGPEGRATLSLARGGVRVDLSGGVTVRVGAADVTLLSGPPSAINRVQPRQVSAAALPGGLNLDRMGGLARNPSLGSTTGPTVADLRPRITWWAMPQVVEVQARLEELAADAPPRRVFVDAAPAGAGGLDLSEGLELKPGSAYGLTLSYREEGGRWLDLPEVLIKVLDRATAQELAAQRKAAEEDLAARPDDATPLVLLMGRYYELGLYGPAYEAARRVAVLRPDDPLPLRVMAAVEMAWQRKLEADAMEARARDREARP